MTVPQAAVLPRRSVLYATLCLGLLLACDRSAHRPVEDQVAVPSTVDSITAALGRINQQLAAQPANATLYVQRAAHYAALDSSHRAIADMQRAISIDSTNPGYHLYIGDLLYRVIRVEPALDHFETASRLDPENTKALLKRAEIELVLRRHQAAMDNINTALRKDPNVGHGYYLKGFIHMEMRDTAKAISSLRTAVEQDPQDFSSYILLGKLSSAQGDPLAPDYYRSALEVRPRSVEGWYNLGMHYQENNQDSLALDAYARIMSIDDNNALAWYNTGWVRLEHLGQYEQACRDFMQAIDREPEFADAWYNRGVGFERRNLLDSAEVNYRMAMVMAPNHDLAAEALERLSSQGVRIKLREGAKH